MDNYVWKAGFWTAVAVAVVMIAIAAVSMNGYGEALDNIATLEWDLESARTSRDRLLVEKKGCKSAARVEFLEGQLESCNGAYAEEKHNRKFYQKALEDVPAYCSLGLNQFVIDSLGDDLNTCRDSLEYVLSGDLRGAPCHQHYDGLHCTWERPRYDLAIQNICDSEANCSSCVIMTEGDYDWCFYHTGR